MTQSFKDAGIKSTGSRIAVLEILENDGTPMDVSMIIKSLDKMGLNPDQATVYRILNTFYEKGIIKRIEIGEGKYRYEKSDMDHHHLICSDCGSITDVEDEFMEKIEKEIELKKGFLVKNHSLEFFGLCQNCQS